MNAAIPRNPLLPSNAHAFQTLGEFQTEIESLEDVDERPVSIDGVPFPRFKGLVLADSERPITIVGRNYRPFPHRLVLSQVAGLLERRDMQPQGYLVMDGLGRLNTKLHFPNPRFLLDIRLRSKDQDELMYLGLALLNTYGEPTCALHVEAMGLNPNRGHHMLVGSILGRARIPHLGDVYERVESAINRLTLDAELLANRIQDADSTFFASRDEARLALRGAGFGPRLTTALLDGTRRFHAVRDPLSAWTIFDAITRFVCSGRGTEQGRDENLRRAEAFLAHDPIAGLVAAGEEIERHEAAAVEVQHLHATSDIDVAVEA